MEADPSALALGDEILKSLFRDRRPVIRRIVELDEELVLRESLLIDAPEASDVVNREIVLGGQLVQVELGRVDELLMVAAAALRERNNAELGRPRPCIRRLCAGRDSAEDEQHELRGTDWRFCKGHVDLP